MRPYITADFLPFPSTRCHLHPLGGRDDHESTTACSKDNIKHGFIQAGIIGKEFNRYPIFSKILATCHQQPTLEEYRTVLESFEDFIEIMDEKGHIDIDEEQYDIRGIRMDKDISGQDVFRTAGIAQESFQRSKCLT